MQRNWSSIVIIGLASTLAPSATHAHANAAQPRIDPPLAKAEITDANGLLTALETADRDLRKLAATVTRVKDSMLAGSRQIWRGRLYYLIDPPAQVGEPSRRRFAVMFDSLEAEGRLEERPQHFLFDGRVLYERLADEKLQTEREIVGPGEVFDPMRVGEGPLPIPVGQRKADILARYDAELLPTLDGLGEDERSLRTHVDSTYQLRLTPKPAIAEEDDFREIRLWYTRESLLPVLARTINQAEDIETVQLLDPRRNAEAKVPASAFEIAAPEGWTVQRIEWRGRAQRPAAEGERIEFRAEFSGPTVKPAPDAPASAPSGAPSNPNGPK